MAPSRSVLPQRIASVEVSAPDAVERGGEFEATFRALDADGNPVGALLPVEMRLLDATGKEIGGGWMAAEDGVCTARFETNLDDPDGSYRIECCDRASGLAAARAIRRR